MNSNHTLVNKIVLKLVNQLKSYILAKLTELVADLCKPDKHSLATLRTHFSAAPNFSHATRISASPLGGLTLPSTSSNTVSKHLPILAETCLWSPQFDLKPPLWLLSPILRAVPCLSEFTWITLIRIRRDEVNRRVNLSLYNIHKRDLMNFESFLNHSVKWVKRQLAIVDV